MLGLGLTDVVLRRRSAGSGGGGDTYIAPAVHFDGTVSFGTASLTAPIDSGVISYSAWWQAEDDPDFARFIFECDGRQPGGAYTSGLWVQPTPGDPELPAALDVYLSDSASNSFIGHGEYEFDETAWHHVLVSADTNHANGLKIFRVYVDDVDVTNTTDGYPAFVMTWNGKSLDIGSAGDGSSWLVGNLADLRIMPGVALHDGTGFIPEATRRLFIDADGKPVDPAIATAGLGAAGSILCSGDASTFFVNRGTGGALTASSGSTGSLTNATSPSD